MGFLDTVLGRKPAAPKASNDDLFDDEFQRKLDYLALVSKRVFAGRMRAERRTKKSGSGVEFADHRDYQPGDDFRYLDWNVYQRFDRLLLRLYEEEEDLAIYFVVDASASMGFGDAKKLRYAKRVAAALAYVGLANLDRVSIVSTTDQVLDRMPATRGKARIFKVFRFLKELEPTGHTDPAEAKPKLSGDVLVYDCETGDEREVTVTAKVLERFELAYREYMDDIDRFCTSKQVPYIRADVNTSFDELILRVFRRGGFLR